MVPKMEFYNEPHSYLVKLGVSYWNDWRERNPEVTPFLAGVNLNLLDLSGFNLRGANLKGSNLFGTDLIEADLTGANLSKADLTAADLGHANFRGATITDVRLIRSQALGTNFEQAILTGSCIEDWNIDSATNLNDVICDYIYLKSKYCPETRGYLLQERRPYNGIFEPGEFTKLFQKTLETLDLVFRHGIDWQAFIMAFKELNRQRVDAELSVQGVENKESRTLVVRLNVKEDDNKAEIEQSFKRLYQVALEKTEIIYLEKFAGKVEDPDLEIASYRQRCTNLQFIIEMMALASGE
ncbi:MAG TPA: pentapeptide repeat-containing protein [Cyanobacteria bacterium UBA11159]|nr:pentapeptide repeat-containing protein [Cyanobacteria bacterium UBA11367]HBE57419.1 pentapeptide repeat-containing protein [Cyanobacteria bacterium UBA11366]HBK66145.1 pentapeptide repeat-containing protein [Cyanobacteria bacterium UBA11166]HBR77112.1 pentapeptide repeat-containing protein [Cyanobacteria bacterium UBA11159]HBS69736.1 pentapeptide repeat-containing protein [Cyanobacteria bacterium UBA11153]HCA97579.1 pentapeptide repeat-containing protein [Cyanobacteria bacterium UBA9226]